MYKQNSVLQDGPLRASGRVRDVIASVASDLRFNRLRAAVAYASLAGCNDLDALLHKTTNAWKAAEKKWLLSIDYGHTDPKAIRYLKRLTKSEVRIHDGMNLLRRKLRPAASFHPKTFVFDRSGRSGARRLGFILGSANLTSGGLDSNVEHVVGMRFTAAIGKHEKYLFGPVAGFDDWWDLAWSTADPATPKFLKSYEGMRPRYHPQVRDRRGAAPRRKLPAPVKQLRTFARWEKAACFWIETRHLFENFGEGAAGNQLDAKRGTRVYFGFSPYRNVRRQTRFGEVKMKFGNKLEQLDRAIWFADNSMDRIQLPVPGSNGPTRYDYSVVHFRRVAPKEFVVSLGTHKSVASWRRRSQREGLLHRMAGGRRFGFYS